MVILLLEQIKEHMKVHDWFFDYADDGTVFNKGWLSWTSLIKQIELVKNNLTEDQKIEILKLVPIDTGHGFDFRAVIEKVLYGDNQKN